MATIAVEEKSNKRKASLYFAKLLLQLRAVEPWDGKLPVDVGNESLLPFLLAPKLVGHQKRMAVVTNQEEPQDSSRSNPYQSPTAGGQHVSPFGDGLTRTIVTAMIIVISVGALLQLSTLSIMLAFDWIRPLYDFMAPRFGAISLILGLNVVASLVRCLKKKDHRLLFFATGWMAFIRLLNAAMLLWQVTKSVLQHPSDRLHSSWLYAVLPCFVGAAILLVLSLAGNKADLTRYNTE